MSIVNIQEVSIIHNVQNILGISNVPQTKPKFLLLNDLCTSGDSLPRRKNWNFPPIAKIRPS